MPWGGLGWGKKITTNLELLYLYFGKLKLDRKPAFVCGSCFPPHSPGRLRNSGELADCCVHHKLAQVQSRYF